MKNATKPSKCPDCGSSAERVLPASVSGVYQQNVTGPVPQNTGVSKLDAHIDRVIGKSAAQGWTVQEERNARKRELLEREQGISPAHLSMNPDGTYRVMTDEEAGVHHRANTINSKAMETLRKTRQS